MINPFKKETIYIRLFENKIQLRHLDSGQTINRTCSDKFSSERLLVASCSIAIKFIRDVLSEVQKDKLLKSSLVVLIQPMEKIEGGVSEVERMVFNDLIEQIGGKYAFVHDTQENLTDDEVRKITKS